VGTKCATFTFVVHDSKILLANRWNLTVSSSEARLLTIAGVTVLQSIRAVAVDAFAVLTWIGITIVNILTDILLPGLRLRLPNH
jgi:Mn2+/Fe2+ NRAMP family transporter